MNNFLYQSKSFQFRTVNNFNLYKYTDECKLAFEKLLEYFQFYFWNAELSLNKIKSDILLQRYCE